MIWLSQNYICVEYDFATLRLNESAWNKEIGRAHV